MDDRIDTVYSRSCISNAKSPEANKAQPASTANGINPSDLKKRQINPCHPSNDPMIKISKY